MVYVGRSNYVEYQLIYAATNAGFPWEGPLISLVIVAISIYWIRNRERLPEGWREIGPLIGGFAIVFASCIAIVVVASKWTGYNKVQEVIKNNTAAVAEGPVRSFSVSSAGQVNSFTVDGIHFQYSQYSDSFGYHDTQAAGSPIKDGLVVRIHWTDIEGDPSTPVILKLEIQK